MLNRLFHRGRSISEKDSPPMCEAKEKRPRTVPTPDNNSVRDLARFADALPDSHQDLFRKLIQEAPTEFHGFTLLPQKLRVKIWTMTLPKGREIRLRVQYHLGIYDKSEFGFPPPATLYVNKESRAIATKHFYFFAQNLAFPKMPSLPEKPVCYCIDPLTDKISISFTSLFTEHFSLMLKTMFVCIPKCLDAIRVLEIVDVYQAGYAHQDNNYPEVREFLLDNVACFHHLDEIRFILNDREEQDQEIVKEWKHKVNKAFAREKRRDPECNIPNIICVSWKVREAMKFLGVDLRP